MIRGVASKVMWVGRATVFLVGLAVILALLFGAISRAAAHSNVDNKLFHLAHANSASKPTALVSTLADAAKSALIVNNKSGGSALDLKVSSNEVAPMKVNSNKVVGKLNSDMVDGKHAGAFLPKGATAADSAKLDGKAASEFAGASHNHDDRYYTETETEDRYLAKNGKAADAEKLDNLDSSAYGIKTEHNREKSSDCDTPNVNNNCAPVTVVVPPGKTYHVSIWSSLSWTGTSAAQDMEYCTYRIAVGGGAQGDGCVTPFGILNRITLPANQRAAASVSGETTLGPGTWQLATTVAPLASQVTDSDRNWIITKVMIRDASAPAPTIQ